MSDDILKIGDTLWFCTRGFKLILEYKIVNIIPSADYWGERDVEESYLVQCVEGGGLHENNFYKYSNYTPEDYFTYQSICVGKDLVFLKFYGGVDALHRGAVHNNKDLKFFRTQKEAFDFKSVLIKYTFDRGIAKLQQKFEKETLELQQEIEKAKQESEDLLTKN